MLQQEGLSDCAECKIKWNFKFYLGFFYHFVKNDNCFMFHPHFLLLFLPTAQLIYLVLNFAFNSAVGDSGPELFLSSTSPTHLCSLSLSLSLKLWSMVLTVNAVLWLKNLFPCLYCHYIIFWLAINFNISLVWKCVIKILSGNKTSVLEHHCEHATFWKVCVLVKSWWPMLFCKYSSISSVRICFETETWMDCWKHPLRRTS